MAAVLGTPVAVYGLLFWDHAPAAGLGEGAAALIMASGLRDPGALAFLAGVLGGLGVWLRTEMYLFALALVLGAWRVFGKHVAARIAVGALVSAMGVWILNASLFGHPLGLKGEAAVGARVAEIRSVARAAGTWVRHRLLVLYDLLGSTERPQNGEHPERVSASLMHAGTVVAGGILLAWGIRGQDGVRTLAGAVVAVLGPVSAAVGGQHLMGLLPTVPLMATLLLTARAPFPEVRFPLLVASFHTAAVLATGSVGGLQWGPRYLLPAVPLFVWATIAALARGS